VVKARVTSKGQITVPKEVRVRLAIQPGDDLLFDIRGNRVEMIPRRRQGVAELAGLFPAKRRARDEQRRSWASETHRLERGRPR
jgi:AbrB family looped-hinge helix DNA binding protein